jgi:hypothetical protein
MQQHKIAIAFTYSLPVQRCHQLLSFILIRQGGRLCYQSKAVVGYADNHYVFIATASAATACIIYPQNRFAAHVAVCPRETPRCPVVAACNNLPPGKHWCSSPIIKPRCAS